MTVLRQVRTPEDVALVAELAETIWKQHFTPIIGEAQVGYMLQTMQSAKPISTQIRELGYDYRLIESDDGVALGYTATVPTDRRTAQLSKLYLLSGQRGEGLGRWVIDVLASEWRKQGGDQLWLTVNRYNESAIAFYERVGFAIVGTCVTDIGGGFIMDDYEMRKSIGSS